MLLLDAVLYRSIRVAAKGNLEVEVHGVEKKQRLVLAATSTAAGHTVADDVSLSAVFRGWTCLMSTTVRCCIRE